jgi:hypothetical protein
MLAPVPYRSKLAARSHERNQLIPEFNRVFFRMRRLTDESIMGSGCDFKAWKIL